MSADEERRFQAMQQAQAVLARRLANLRAQAARSGDRQAAADLGRLVAQARSAAQAAATLAAYLAAQVSAENLQGEWAADSRYVRPATRKAWKKAAPLVEDLTTGTDVGFVFTSDLSKVDGWAPLDTPIDVPAGTDLGTEVTALPLADAPPSLPGEEEGVPGAMVLGDAGSNAGNAADAGNAGDAEAIEPGDAPVPAPAVPREEKGAPPAGDKKTEGKPEGGPAAAPAAIPAPAPAPPPPPAAAAPAAISPDLLH